jgi:succinate-semialdehyde dehydrogenase/glutarate-semialdehyde dehydrogenase
MGPARGAEGIRKFTESQAVAEQRLMPLGPPPGKSVADCVRRTNGQLALLRRLRVR